MLCDACKHHLLPPHALPTPEQTDALRQFLRSGALPLDTSQYHSQIATSEAGLARYDAEIEKLHEALGALLADCSKLQEYADGLRAAMSPIRALPAEILGEIFTPFSRSESVSNTSYEELDNLAKGDLLDFSKVCSRWHRVVLGTPRLWSDIAVDLDYWSEDEDDTRFLHLLSTALERSAHHPLTLSLIIDHHDTVKYEHSVSALTLVAEHSQRWQHMSYRGDLSGLDHISHIKGKLHNLETLSLDSREGETVSDTFEIAPSLTKVSLDLENTQFYPKLPWNQLQSFTCNAMIMRGFSFINSMRNLSLPRAACKLRCLNTWQQGVPHWQRVPHQLPQITTTISSFDIVEMMAHPLPGYDSHFLGALFGCLTFTHLHKLSFYHVAGSQNRLRTPWPISQFQSLSFRSSFCDTLRVLEIPAVAITDDELLSSLASLGSLVRLVISDQLEFGGVAEHVLITDALLLRLTDTADLVPKLKTFICTSLYKFSADVYFGFVTSRIVAGGELFHCGLCHFRKTACEFDSGVRQKLLELVERRELGFSIGEEGKGC